MPTKLAGTLLNRRQHEGVGSGQCPYLHCEIPYKMPARTIAAFGLGGGTGKERGSQMAVVECTEGRYEAHNGEFGKIYRWCPECLLVKCDCGETTTLDDSYTTCVWCGADHTS